MNHTREELLAAFKKVEDKQNWKMPLLGVIEEAEFAIVNEAAIFFAGSPLRVVKKAGIGKILVRGEGYYVCIGA